MNQLDSADIPLSSSNPEAEKPTLRRFLFGDDGLRAGWSMLLFVLVVVLIGVAATAVIRHWHLLPKSALDGNAAMRPKSTLIGDGLQFLGFAFAAWIMSLIERRPFTRYGLEVKRALPDVAAGLVWGFVCLSLLVGTLYLTHSLAFDGFAIHGVEAVSSGAQWLAAFFCVGLAEEFFTRGYIQYTVSRGVSGITRALDPHNRYAHAWGFWVSAFLFSGLLFMVGHLGNPGETVPGILAVGLAGLTFAFSLWRTGSLWWAIGFHATWDWSQSYLYGTHDSGIPAAGHLINSHPVGQALLSGGNTGPEGSIFVLPTLLVVGAIIHFTLPRRDYFLTPDQSPLPAVEGTEEGWVGPSTATPI